MAREATAGAAGRPLTILTEPRRFESGRFWRRFRRERKAFVGLAFVLVLVVVSVFGPLLAPHDPDVDDFGLFEAPSFDHPMGTDSFGRDLFSRVIVGTRVSFAVGILAALSAMVIGVLLGMLAGYYGGWADSIISRAIDLLWAFPVIILAVGMVAVFGAGIRNVVLAISIAFLDDFARIVRAQMLSLREED